MADKLIFPIAFDLEAAVKEAQGDADRLLRRLQTTINSKPLAVNLKINGAGDGSIDNVNARMRELVKQWNSLTEAERVASKTSGEYTAEAKRILAEYTRLVGASQSYARTLQQIDAAARRSANAQEKLTAKQRREWEKLRKTISSNANTIDALSAKIKAYQQRLNGLEVGSSKFEKTAEKIKKLSRRLDEAKRKVAELTGKMPAAAASVNQVSEAFKTQDGYVSRLIKRLAVYAGYSMISSFLTNVREVTAQFELQRVSLGAIIQDQQRANALFSEIKSFALKSPVSILDLTKYTKQVAAYRIETDKLFDTTKRLADVSVGLGVDMGRIVLAYGQVKAASYLRAAEIRQFTEAGIPMLELLAEKFTELEGKMVSTEKVMDLVSKRAVSFSMVEEIFNDMTSAGGMFYNMQEKQGNTLYGLWAKLGDAASVMYDEIGNTDSVNSAMKDTIQLLTDLMKNWRLVGRELSVLGAAFAIIHTNTKLSTVNTQHATAATNQYAAAQEKLNAAKMRGATTSINAAKASMRAAAANRAAANATNVWTAAQFRLIGAANSLKAAFLGNWITLTIAAVAAIGAAIYSAYEKANKLKNELNEIQDSGAAESAKTVFNFQRLANAALDAANGSKEQKDALDELKRTYKDIIPSEQLSLENLRKLREQGYEPLTAAIKEYIAQRTLQKEIDAITSNYTEDTIKKQRELRELFKRGSTYNFFKGRAKTPIEGLDDDQLSQVFANVEKIAQDKSKKWEDVWIEAIKGVADVSEEAEAKMRSMFNNRKQNAQQATYNNKMRDIVENTRAMATETDAASKKMESQTGSLGKYKQVLDKTTKSLSNFRALWGDGTPVDTKSFLYSQMFNNASIIEWKDDIIEDLKDAGIEIKNDWFSIINKLNPKDSTTISAINFEPILASIDAAKDRLGDKYVPLKNAILKYQELYNGIVPTDATVSVIRKKFKEIADETGTGFIDKVKMNLMGADETLKDYQKKIKDTVEELADTIKSLNAALAVTPAVTLEYGSLLGELQDAQEKKEFYDKILALLPSFDKSKGGKGGRQSDSRLGILQEMVSTLKQVNKEYDELAKKEGATKALADTQRVYADTFKNMQQLAAKYNFDLPDFGVPTDTVSLTKYLDAIKAAMAKLPKSDKAVLALQVDIEKLNIDDMQKKIEKKLKELSDKISRTKTAKEFYDKILSQTGSYDIAGSVTMSIYGDDGQNLLRDTIEQLQTAFENVDISAAIDLTTGAIDYNMLRKFEEEYSDKLIAGRKDLRDKLISEGEKASAAQVAQWYKDIEKAKDYNQQYVDIVRETQTKIAEIRRSGLDKDVEDELVKGMEDKQRKALAKLQLDEFKSSDLYVRLFEDMDSASTTMLQSLKDKLDEMKKTMREDLTPAELKSLTQDIEKLEEVLQQRNPFKTITKGLKGLRQWHKENGSLADAEKKLTDAIAVEDAARKQWEADTQAAAKAQAELNAALQQYQAIVAVKGEDSEEAQAAKANADAKRDEANAANNSAKKSEETYNSAKKTKEEAQETVRSWEEWVDSMREGLKVFGQIEGILSDMTDAANNFMDVFAASDETRQFFDDVLGGLNSIIGGAEKAATGMLDAYAGFVSANPMQMIQGGMSAISGLSSIAKGVTDIFYAGRIKKANKEIKRQQEILEQLQYTYSRLEKAADKVFGSDYINNFKQQERNLQAQAEAYRKQYEAELSKGKKADEAKLKEYENAYRDTMDEIADMQGRLAEKFLGSDQASAARDFAKAWIDAYKEVGRAGAETSNAMKEKFQDMVENMVVEGAMAAVMQKALQPMFDMINNMNEQDFSNEAFWKKVAETAKQGAEDADKGAQTLMKFLEQAGISIKDINAEYTGIKRDVASATSEEMNANTAALNTQNYYVSHIPDIAANVALIRQLMESGAPSALPAASTGWTDWQQQAMDHYAAIQRNTADTVVECRRAAIAAEDAVAALRRVIIPKGSTASFGVQVYLPK